MAALPSARTTVYSMPLRRMMRQSRSAFTGVEPGAPPFVAAYRNFLSAGTVAY